jgi:hypothetical protein
VVLGMDSSNVDAVFIGGTARKWRGQLVDADLDGVLRELAASGDRLATRIGGGVLRGKV